MQSLSFVLALAALAACANAGAVSSGRTLNPMVWPMPKLGVALSPEIIGGDDADQGEFPHQVSMQISFLWVIEQHICGATVISESWVLTAAHCIKGTPWYTSNFILAGKTNLGRTEEGQQRRAVKKRFVHEKYQWNNNNGVGPFDIGLLLLKSPLQLSDTVKIARLPVQGAIPTGVATLSGWGSTSTSQTPVMPSQLQKETLPIISFEDCNAFMEAASQGEDNPLRDTNVCVGYLQTKGQGACSGDSGGPLIQKDGDDVVVIGATSWGFFPCQDQPAPSVYTRVSAYVDWIQEKMQKNK